jgi:hypothetical protein
VSVFVVMALPMLEARLSRVLASKYGYAVDWAREWVFLLTDPD